VPSAANPGKAVIRAGLKLVPGIAQGSVLPLSKPGLTRRFVVGILTHGGGDLQNPSGWQVAVLSQHWEVSRHPAPPSGIQAAEAELVAEEMVEELCSELVKDEMVELGSAEEMDEED
jgi:hypothetical protein